MDELVERLAAKAGIEKAVAEKTAYIMLDFLRNRGPSDHVELLIDRTPGADTAVQASHRGAGLSALMGSGLMAAGSRLMGLGLGIEQIRNAAQELVLFGRGRIGTERMEAIVKGTPGLSQFA
jgi:hypothetical protein